MYMTIYIYMYISIYLSIYLSIYVYIYICIYVYRYTYMKHRSAPKEKCPWCLPSVRTPWGHPSKQK